MEIYHDLPARPNCVAIDESGKLLAVGGSQKMFLLFRVTVDLIGNNISLVTRAASIPTDTLLGWEFDSHQVLIFFLSQMSRGKLHYSDLFQH